MAIRDQILQRINSYNADQIKTLIEKQGFVFKELIDSNIDEEKLIEIGVQYLKGKFDQGIWEWSGIDDLGDEYAQFKKAIKELDVNFFDQHIFQFDSAEPIVNSVNNKQAIIEDIINLKESAKSIKDYINQGVITREDLVTQCGLSSVLADRLVHYVNNPILVPPMSELGRPEAQYTDVYFLGIPGSGKTCMMAGLFAYMNRFGLMNPNTTHQWGTNYRNHLISKLDAGLLPESTGTGVINYMPIGLREPDKMERTHPLNIIEMAGERFINVSEKGMSEFDQILDFLKNDNRKLFVLVVDYAQDTNSQFFNSKKTQQNLSLTTVLNLFEQNQILKNSADGIFIAVTKADLFPKDQDQADFAAEYLNTHYLNLVNLCREYRQKYSLALRALPFSIGPAIFNSMLEDHDPRTNTALDHYPQGLVQLLLHYSHYRN